MKNLRIQYSFFYLTVLFFLLPVLPGCSRNQPLDIRAGEEICKHCHMTVADLRFNAQLLTDKGKRLQFDSLECLGAYLKEIGGIPEHVWVSALDRGGDWIPLREAHIRHARAIRSPMGGHLAAYGDRKAMDLAIQEEGGREVSVRELASHDLAFWKDTFEEKVQRR